MKYAFSIAAGMIAAAAITANAWAAMKPGDVAGKEEAQIIRSLETSGYTEIEIEAEDGIFEVEAMLDGAEVEMEVSSETGEVLTVDGDEEDNS